jgi:hypothetical protein
MHNTNSHYLFQGELVYSRLLNQEIILINTEKVARDLLERRSNNYSDRPGILCLTNDLYVQSKPRMQMSGLPNHGSFGWSFNSVMIKYNDRWRLHRRLLYQAFRAQAAFTYQPMQLRKARELLNNLLEDPVNWRAHIQT